MREPGIRRSRNGVYRARWKRDGETFVAHVQEAPHIRANGSDLTEVMDRLYWDLFAALGDELEFLQPVPAYAPRLAVSKPGIRIAPWVAISSARGEFDVLNAENELWKPPPCQRCARRAERQRTRTRLRARLLTPGALATPFQLGLPTVRIAPDSFRATLTRSEQAAFSWLPVEIENARRTTERWWELRPRRYHVRCCGIKGEPASGRRCRTCKRTVFSYGVLSHDMTRQYLAEPQVAGIRRTLIVEGTPGRWDILLSHARWLELHKSPAFKGVVAEFYGLVPDRLVVQTPRIIPPDTYHKQFMKSWERRSRRVSR